MCKECNEEEHIKWNPKASWISREELNKQIDKILEDKPKTLWERIRIFFGGNRYN